MIYTIVGTNISVREKAHKELSQLGTVSSSLYSEHIGGLEALVDASSLFGERVVVTLQQVMDDAKAKDVLTDLLSSMKASSNIFIIDEPFADANRIKVLTKFSEKVFNGKEEKEKLDPFKLATLFGARDKKGVWLEWMRIRDLDAAESLHGVLWWKWKTIWEGVREGKPSKFSLAECEAIGRELVRAPILAHRGETDLKRELERVILSV
jgi:hypothetical protein